VEKDQVLSNYPSQFGTETLFTLEPSTERGQYTMKGSNGKYVFVDGTGKVTADKVAVETGCLFFLEPVSGYFAFKSVANGAYLSPLAKGLKAGAQVVSSKELFIISDSDPQVVLKASNGKYLSFQGTNIMSNRTEITQEEIWIMEFVNEQVAFRSVQDKYWSNSADGGVTVSATAKNADELWTIEYHGAKVALKSSHGGYLTAKPLGGADAKAKAVSEKELFQMFLHNRPQIVLQANQQGFVGSNTNGKEASAAKVSIELLTLEYNAGSYAIKTAGQKYFSVGPDKVILGDQPEWFNLEFHNGKVAIRTASGKYLKSEQQGWLSASAESITPTELFEM